MRIALRDWRRNVVWQGLACAVCLALAGCGESVVNSGVVPPGTLPRESPAGPSDADSTAAGTPAADGSPASDANPEVSASTGAPASATPARTRTVTCAAPDGAPRGTST